MCPDVLSESVHYLPNQLDWETVCNLETLSALELRSTVVNTSVPIELWVKVTGACNMKRRASEERTMVHEEIIRVVEFYTSEHTALLYHMNQLISTTELTLFQKGCLNLLKHHLLFCEALLLNLSKGVQSYHNVDLPTFHLVNCDTEEATNLTVEDIAEDCSCHTDSDEDSMSDDLDDLDDIVYS